MVARIMIDNISKNELIPEGGLSIYIEHEGHRLLLDTGGSDAFARNAKTLGILLAEIEYGGTDVYGACAYNIARKREEIQKRDGQAGERDD